MCVMIFQFVGGECMCVMIFQCGRRVCICHDLNCFFD